MKYLLFLISLAFFCPAYATVAEADSAYLRDDFPKAIELYQSAIDSLGPSAERYYNLGNAYYRNKQLGQALVSYERALRLAPTDKDIKENIEFVNSRTADAIAPSQSFFGDIADTMAGLMHPNAWAWIAIASFVLALAGVALYFLSDYVLYRKIGFFGCGILIIVCVFANILAWRGTLKATSDSMGVVVTPSVILSTTPRQPSSSDEEAMVLHDGATFAILDSLKSGKEMWYDVKVNDNQRAWIPGSAIEII